MTEVISIKFRGRGKTYYFDPAGVTARTGDTLVVETSKGMELGECVKGNHMVGDGDCVQPLRPVVRRATPDDLRIAELNRKREKEALGICRELIEKHKLPVNNAVSERFNGVYRLRHKIHQRIVKRQAAALGVGVCLRHIDTEGHAVKRVRNF